jgi:hypothetical protein
VSPPLRPLAPDLWVAERPFTVLRFLDIGTRMTVVRLPDGGLLLHSPVEADEETRKAVAALGPVALIACPNKVHHLFAGGWARAHPDALLLGAPGLPEKRRDLAFHALLGDDPHPGFQGAVETHWVRGMPLLNEVAFLHRPSRTLLLTDLAFYPTPASRPGLRRWCWISRVRTPLGPNGLVRLGVRDRRAARESIDRVLAWDFDRVTVTHGEVFDAGRAAPGPLDHDAGRAAPGPPSHESGGRETLRKAWEWL